MERFYNVIKRLTGKENTSNVICLILYDSDELESKETWNANGFNTFFSNIGSKLVKSYPQTHANDHSYVSKVPPTILEVSNIDARLEIEFWTLDSGKAAVINKINSKKILMLHGIFKESVSGISLKA